MTMGVNFRNHKIEQCFGEELKHFNKKHDPKTKEDPKTPNPKKL